MTTATAPTAAAARWAGALLLLWLGAALAAGASGVLTVLPRGVPQAMAVALGVTTALIAALAPQARALVDAIPLNALVGVHMLRAPVGAALVALGANGVISPMFGTRAGIGDIVVGLGAMWLVLSGAALSRRRWAYLAWNTLGLIDFAIVLGTAAQVAAARPLPGVVPLLHLPLSLLPTFAVPFLLATHITLFRRIRVAARG